MVRAKHLLPEKYIQSEASIQVTWSVWTNQRTVFMQIIILCLSFANYSRLTKFCQIFVKYFLIPIKFMTRSHNVTQVELVTTDVDSVQNKQNRLRQRLWPESVMYLTFKTTDLISSARLHKGSASLYFPLLPYSTAKLFRVAATAGWFSPSVFSLQIITNQRFVFRSRDQS